MKMAANFRESQTWYFRRVSDQPVTQLNIIDVQI